MIKKKAFCINLYNDYIDCNNLLIEEYFLNYLNNIVNYILNYENNISNKNRIQENINVISEQIFNIITSREFNYQSKQKIFFQKDNATKKIKKYLNTEMPIKFYMALGAGYKAAIDREGVVNFQLGLGELLSIYQICRLEQQILNIYPAGINFKIVIDNGVANYANDIPISKTEEYVKLFRKLIKKLKKDNTIELLVQTEFCDWINESKKIQLAPFVEVTDEDYENIIRFLGRDCSKEEAILRKKRYLAAMSFSSKVFEYFINNEIWFLQYSLNNHLTFRSFPGGASRIQVGDVAIKNINGKINPFLISTRNKDEYTSTILTVGIDQFFEIIKINKDKVVNYVDGGM